ncbi:hypothetical protein B0H10DRAFT_2165535 [Mycena sp. CBHHK59/15]|nr:hypothetical protein B0H10DRAFT_2165535 [Mycena sp. CBHHK59/15]
MDSNLTEYNEAPILLKCLVVHHLLELTKLSMSGVGYKLHKKIGKALKMHADAIHRALSEYNVIQTVSLAKFNVLCDTCNNIRTLPWTNPTCHKAVLLYFGIKCSKEEIWQLNIEITRLIIFMIDEHIDYYRAIFYNYLTDPDLTHELSKRWTYHAKINESVVEHLVKASRLPGFMGTLFPGSVRL